MVCATHVSGEAFSGVWVVPKEHMNKQKLVSFTHPHSLTCKGWQLAKMLDMFLSKMAIACWIFPKKVGHPLGVEADIAQFSPRSTTEFSFTKNTSNLSKGHIQTFPRHFRSKNPLGHWLSPKAFVATPIPKKLGHGANFP